MIQLSDTRYSEWRRRQSLFLSCSISFTPASSSPAICHYKKKLLLLVFEFVFVGWVPLAIWVLLSFSACSNRFKMVALSWISSSLAFHDLADQWSLINDCVDAFGNQLALWSSWELCSSIQQKAVLSASQMMDWVRWKILWRTCTCHVKSSCQS